MSFYIAYFYEFILKQWVYFEAVSLLLIWLTVLFCFCHSFLSVYLRKLADDECPLRLRLCAGPGEKAMSLVLRENEAGEVNVSML